MTGILPGGLFIDCPFGQSLGRDKVAQIDARRGRGGAKPDVTVPMTLRNAVRVQRGDDVVLEYGLKTLRGMMG